MPQEPKWPPPDPKCEEAAKLLYQAKLGYLQDLAKAEEAEDLERLKGQEATALKELEASIAREKAQQESDTARIAANESAINASIAAFHSGIIEVSKTTIDRARAGAETVQKAAAAIGGSYTAVLALAFSVSERPLPSRGLVPTVLLGWAVVWSTVYLAYLTKGRGVRPPLPTPSFETGAMRRSIAFIEWTRSGAFNRKYALHVSVFALAFGLALLPAPFVNSGGSESRPPTVASEPPWPPAPQGGSELEKIRYEAEVKEVATLRAETKPIANSGDDSAWWVLCVLALLLSLIFPAILALRDKRREISEAAA